MIISEVLKKQGQKLNNKSRIKSPHLEAEILLSFILKKSREHLLSHGENELSAIEFKKYENLIKKRLAGWPIAYLVGHKQFHSLDFVVNKNVLIPRPETELIVDYILDNNIKNLNKAVLVDVGTGSGCIAITLAKKLSPAPKIKIIIASDISAKALRVAKQNSRLHKTGSKIKFIKGNLLDPILGKEQLFFGAEKLIITANLPYLTPKQVKNEPSITKEPKIALKGGKDGLKHYEELFLQASELAEDFPGYIYILCEINPEQAIPLKKIIRKHLPQARMKIKKDLSEENRLLIVRA